MLPFSLTIRRGETVGTGRLRRGKPSDAMLTLTGDVSPWYRDAKPSLRLPNGEEHEVNVRRELRR